MDRTELREIFDKYCKKLRIVPAWDVKLEFVEDPTWRKTGDFKVDCDDRKAVFLLNAVNPEQENLEEVIVHELNLTEDGVLTNMITLSRDFMIHTGHITMDRPGFIFAATDGCFGYLSTPMEFEYLLLETMLSSDCVSSDSSGVSAQWMDRLAKKVRLGWQEKLCEVIGKIAGDDYTISGYAIGFNSFEEMKKAFIGRANTLYSQFISGLEEKSYDDKFTLWQQYKDNYHRFLCRS